MSLFDVGKSVLGLRVAGLEYSKYLTPLFFITLSVSLRTLRLNKTAKKFIFVAYAYFLLIANLIALLGGVMS